MRSVLFFDIIPELYIIIRRLLPTRTFLAAPKGVWPNSMDLRPLLASLRVFIREASLPTLFHAHTKIFLGIKWPFDYHFDCL
jgi:hypothetical protein